MQTTRRDLLGAGASIALGLGSFGKADAEAAQTPASAAISTSPTWDDGEVAHLLPTSSHERILIKASFKKPLNGAPTLQRLQIQTEDLSLE